MRHSYASIVILAVAIPLIAASGAGLAGTDAPKGPDWKMSATVIEACSCPMFCQCYFNPKPAAHAQGGHGGHGGHGESRHFCRFNNVYRVDTGRYGDVPLDGAKFWISGDLGGDFSQGKMDWAVVTFDRATSKAQREAIQAIVARLFPVHWNSLSTAEGDITWKASGGTAQALLDGGKTAEVKLTTSQLNRNKAAEPVVLHNVRYWGAAANDGFILMPNEVVAYRVGDRAFEYRGTNGFMLTLHADSKTSPPAPAAGSR